MARRYRIGEQTIEDDDPRFQGLVTVAYQAKIRPECLCRSPAAAMYIARIGEQLIAKRMPLTGGGHDPQCPSYEPPYELSGLGPLIGSAIRPDGADGMIRLKLDFPLTKTGSRTAATTEREATAAVRNEAGKLSLRALLHYLWHHGGLTEWTAHWAGKRHWWQVRNHLLEAAGTMTVKGGLLADRLFVPEPFRADDKAGIEMRRASALADIHPPSQGPRKLMLLVGEVKEFAPARSGRRIVVKHMPDFPLMLEDNAFRRLQARHKAAFELWEANQASHLIAIATFGAAASGVVSVEEIALMTVTEQWIPVESVYEERLVQRLSRLSLKSVKGLRFDLPASVPVASATLPQNRPLPVALYIVPPAADGAFETMLTEMISARPDMEPWVWRVMGGDMPDLPVAQVIA